VAAGMLSVRLGISFDEATRRIRPHAFTVNRSVLEVAQDVVERRWPTQ
jgi:AmiR/NasT family two-component response regulator